MALLLTAVPAAEARITRNSQISTKGLGPLKIGMSVGEAERAVGHRLNINYYNAPCGVAGVSRRLGVSILVTGSIVARIYTHNSPLSTRRGIRAGSSIEALRSAYPGARWHRNIYTGYRQYVYRKPRRKIVFDTDNEQVTSISTGRVPEINYVEGKRTRLSTAGSRRCLLRQPITARRAARMMLKNGSIRPGHGITTRPL